ncbi:MAG: PA14 domain-containing protein, partial [Myxococcota bacterium]
IRYYGRITVAGGPMEFALRSRDGSRLFIDGELVIEHDGVHSASEAVGARSLSAGAHDIVVEYFNRDGEAELSLRSRVAGGSFTPVPPSAFALLPSPGAFGGIEHSWWEGIGGGAITDLTAAPDYPDAPTGTDIRSRFETPTNRFDNGGARLRGFLSPPISGTYRFWIASDDSGELWLSTDESPDHRERIAHVPAWTASQEWEKYPEQASASVFLHSGRRYYVDALMKEGTGGDNLAVAWESPVASRAVIDGAYLSPPITELELLGAAGASPQVGAGVEGEYTADAIGDGVTYLWSFGDGSGDVFSESPTVTHRYDTPGRYVVTVMVRDVWGRESTTTFVQSVHLPLNPAAPAASSTIAFHPDRAEVWSVNPDNDSVTVIDANGRAVVDEIFVAAEPRSITIASDGRVWVASAAADTLSVIDPSTSALVEIPLETGAHPRGLVASRHSNRVFVALEHRGEVVEFDGDSLLEEARETLVPGIRELALDGDDAFLLVSRFVSPPAPGESGAAPDLDGAVGEVYRLAASPLASLDVIPLGYSRRLASEHSGPGMPNYLRAPAFSPDGSQVFVPSKQDNIGAGISRDGTALSHDHTVRAISSRIVWPDGLEVLSDRIDHDNASIASAAVFGPYGLYLFTALEGNREVAISDAHLNVEIARIDVGRAPQGLTLSPTGRMLFVHNFMDRTVSV